MPALLGCGTISLEKAYSLDHRHHAELSLSLGGVAVKRDGTVMGRHALVDPDTLRLSEAGAHLAYAAAQDGQGRVFLNGQPAASTWDAVLPGSLHLGEQGPLVYVAKCASLTWTNRMTHAAPGGAALCVAGFKPSWTRCVKNNTRSAGQIWESSGQFRKPLQSAVQA